MHSAVIPLVLVFVLSIPSAEAAGPIFRSGAQTTAPPSAATAGPKSTAQPASPSTAVLCPNVCQNGMMSELKLEGGVCKPVFTASCFPYRCTYDRTLCDTACEKSVECATGAYCDTATKQCVAGDNCPSKCLGDKTASYSRSGMMCRQDRITSCYPYGCDQQSGACGYACASDQQCAAGAMCDAATKSCIPAFARCDKAAPSWLVLADGTKAACDPYMCRGNACMIKCSATVDCAQGFVCDTMYGTCIKPW